MFSHDYQPLEARPKRTQWKSRVTKPMGVKRCADAAPSQLGLPTTVSRGTQYSTPQVEVYTSMYLKMGGYNVHNETN